MAKISVIIPVYNVERYLKKCLDSVLGQSMEDIEIVLVNDGSTDSSGEICRDYASKDPRIRLINQENAGLSAARNTGFSHSSGDYIIYVDSDDYIRPDSCEVLYAAASELGCDIIAANEIKVVKGRELPGERRRLPDRKIVTGKEFYVTSLKLGGMSPCVQFSLYKREFLAMSGISFKEGILHEDELWTPQVLLKAVSVACLDFPFYYHLCREGSITQKKDHSKNSRDMLDTCAELYDVFVKEDRYSRRYMFDNLCTSYLSAVFVGRRKDADRLFALRTARSAKNIIKAIIYAVSPSFYLKLRGDVGSIESRKKSL